MFCKLLSGPNHAGIFSVLPAYIADTFGQKHAGAIHGKGVSYDCNCLCITLLCILVSCFLQSLRCLISKALTAWARYVHIIVFETGFCTFLLGNTL